VRCKGGGLVDSEPLQDVENVLAARGWREVKQIGRTQPGALLVCNRYANVTWNRYRGS
jgi:hypothetical protein